MDDYLLTFEIDKDADQVFVHGDAKGLEFFAKSLLKIATQAKGGECSHEHFYTPEWGGDELSSEVQSDETMLMNHVKVFGWPNKGSEKLDAET